MATLLNQGTFSFADGGSGHVCDLGSAPNVNETDILCVNSDTTVSTPSGGFVNSEQAVANQGAYIFTRKAVGGEGSTVTVTTSGNFNCQVSWQRWSGLGTIDTSTSTQANASIGGATPAHSTGALAEADEIVIAFGALHSIGTANQNTPVWGTFTPLTAAVQGTGTSGVRGYVGYKTGCGPAAETPQVSWSGDGAFDRYMLTVSFLDAGGDAVTGSAVANLGALTGLGIGLRTVDGSGLGNLGPLNGTAQGTVNTSGSAAADLGALTGTALGGVTTAGSASADLGALTATAIGITPDRPSPVQHLEELMATMLACLCEAAAARPNAPQNCCYRIGPEVTYDADMYTDLCCEGLAYVSLGDVYPVVDSFPEQSIVTQANQVCSFPSWAVNIKAGIIRCVPVGTETAMPSCQDWNAAMLQHIFDTQSLASAACCFKQEWIFNVEPGMSVVIGPNSTTSPQGGCVERFITLQVQTSVCPAC